MKMTITEYWNKLRPIDNPTGAFKNEPIRGEYEVHSEFTSESGWKSIKDFRKAAKRKHDFVGEIEPDVFKFKRGSFYGIHSYQLITFRG